MNRDLDYTAITAENIRLGAARGGQRTGQWMFNHLPGPVQNKVVGTLFDPFHKDLTTDEIFQWLDNHIIFDGSEIVGLFDNNTILWEAE